MTLNKIDIEKIVNEKNIFERKDFSIKLDDFHREYQELYYKTNFVN